MRLAAAARQLHLRKSRDFQLLVSNAVAKVTLSEGGVFKANLNMSVVLIQRIWQIQSPVLRRCSSGGCHQFGCCRRDLLPPHVPLFPLSPLPPSLPSLSLRLFDAASEEEAEDFSAFLGFKKSPCVFWDDMKVCQPVPPGIRWAGWFWLTKQTKVSAGAPGWLWTGAPRHIKHKPPALFY